MERRAIQQLGYSLNLNRRWLVERCFTWLKQTGQLRQVNLRGLMNVDWSFAFSCAARNLVRLLRLMAQAVVVCAMIPGFGNAFLRPTNLYQHCPNL
jgi:hypothetical protein